MISLFFTKNSGFVICVIGIILFLNGVCFGQRTGVITGKVTNSETGEPLQYVNVTVKGTSYGDATSSEGMYSIDGVEPGNYVLIFSAIGFSNIENPGVTVSSGDTTVVSVRLLEEVIPMADVLVIGVSRRPESIKEAAAAVSAVTDLKLKQLASTGQIPILFDDQPGVDVAQNGINDFNINSRGFNSTLNRRVLVLQDNRETAMAFLLAQEWNTYSLPLEDLGNLEFVRGPASALYGANAFSGVINITTPAPREMVGTKMTLAVGELNTVRGDFRHAGYYGHWGYKFNVGAVRSDTWSKSRNISQAELNAREYRGLATEFVPLNDEDVSTIYGSGRVDYHFTDMNFLTLESGIAEAEDQVFVTGLGRIQVDDVLRPWSRVRFTADKFFFQADYNGRKTLRGHQTALNSVTAFRENSHDVKFHFQHDISVIPERLRLVWGGSHRLQYVDTGQTLTPEAYQENQSGLYAHLEYRLTERIALIAASRIDRSTLHDTQFSPKAAIVFAPNQDHLLRLTFNRAFETPNYAEFFLRAPAGAPVDLAPVESEIEREVEQDKGLPPGSVDLPLDFGFTPALARGNENLQVEKVYGYELGYKGIYHKQLFFTGAVYFNHLKDFVTDLLPGVNPTYPSYEVPEEIDPELTPIILAKLHEALGDNFPLFSTLPDGSKALVVSYTNAGQVDEWGMELGLNYSLSHEIMFNGNYTFFASKVKDAQTGDALLPNTPKHKFNLGMSYEDRHGVDFRIHLKYVGGFDWAAGIFQGYVPAYTVVSLAGGYEIDRNIRLGLTITNLFDNEHYELFGGSVNGRRALGSVTYQF